MIDILDPVLRLWRGDGDLKENLQDLMPILEETGRQIFTNGSITVNLWPIILGGIALGLCEYCFHFPSKLSPLYCLINKLTFEKTTKYIRTKGLLTLREIRDLVK